MKKEKQNELDNEISTDADISAEDKKTEKKEKAPKITRIGAMLKEMRQQKGLKLIDVSRKLCIRKCYLEAIEDSNYAEIPPFPYGNGFIRSYANFLGLNGENIIELYKEETASSKQKNMNILEPQPEATMPNIQHIIISLLAIALIYAGWFFYNQHNESSEDESSSVYSEEASANDYTDAVAIEEFNGEQMVETSSQDAVKEAQTSEQIVVTDGVYKEEADTSKASEENPKEADKKQDVESDDATNTAETVKLEIPNTGVYIEVLKTTWVEVKDNNKLYLSKVLQPGELYKVPAGEGKILSVGRYDGVNVYINGILSNVVRPQKKMNIYLDKYINPEL